MYLQHSRPLICHLLPNVWKASYTISGSIFVDVPYRPPYSRDKFISCVVSDYSQWFFHFGEEIVVAWTQEKMTILSGKDPIILHDSARRHFAAVTDLFVAGNGGFWNIHSTHPMSPCDYDLFVKVKEPLREIRYNRRDEIHRCGQGGSMRACYAAGPGAIPGRDKFSR